MYTDKMAPTLYTAIPTVHTGSPTSWMTLPQNIGTIAAPSQLFPQAQHPAVSQSIMQAAAPPAIATLPLMMSESQALVPQGPSPSPPLNQSNSQYPMSVTMCMEVVWHGEFNNLFCRYNPHQWSLIPTATPPEDGLYKLFQDSAKVRFSCGTCGKGWTSMKGRVAFWFKLDQINHTGEVLFKLYGQQCQRCEEAGRGEFHHAMWYPEEVVKVIQNLYNRVGTMHYGFSLPPIRIDRRTGKPRAQHDAKLCQACTDGICKEGWTLN